MLFNAIHHKVIIICFMFGGGGEKIISATISIPAHANSNNDQWYRLGHCMEVALYVWQKAYR